MDEEIRFHIESRTEDLIRSGLSLREASRQARLEFGAVAAHKDGMRRSLGLGWWDELRADLLYAVRILRKSPSFTAIAVASLALAIGANTTIFSYANQMLFARLGVPQASQLRLLTIIGDEHMAVHDLWGNGSIGTNPSYLDAFPYPVYQQLRKQNSVLEDLFAFKDLPSVNITAADELRVGAAELVSGNFYTQMHLQPELGRPILPSDDGAPGSGSVVVLSDRFWHSEFGGSRNVLGKTIRVNTTLLTIVGVNPPEFLGAAAGSPTSPELFLPLSLVSILNPGSGDTDPVGPGLWWLQIMARARPGIAQPQAEAALSVALNAALRATTTLPKDETIPRVLLYDGSRGDDFDQGELARPIYILLALAALVLLLACANVANLLLARATARQREVSVRMALGAGRVRILRQLFTESLLLATLGGLCGLVLGYLSRNLIPWLMHTGWAGGELNVPFDWRVCAFTAAITLVTALFFGLAPAWRATRAELNTSLKEGSRSATRSRKSRTSKSLVTFQIALSTLLVLCSALFVRTVLNLESVDPGFRAGGLTLFSITLPGAQYPAPKDIATLHRIEQSVAAIPSVGSATLSSMPFVARWSSSGSFYVEGAPIPKSKADDNRDSAARAVVGSSFFSTMSIPILAGRGFTDLDTETSPQVAVINQALARKFFPNTNPIGKRFRIDNDSKNPAPWSEIVGICANTHYQKLNEDLTGIYFTPYRQHTKMGQATFIVRSHLSAQALLPSFRQAVQQIDPNLPVKDVRTQQQQIDATMQQERLFASLTAGFGLLALALACVGIYGIMAYTVSQRTNEIGIRLALGAVRGQIRSMVLREAGGIAAAGVLAGLGVALLLVRLVKSMLYGLKPYDPFTLAGSGLLLLGMALLASWIPAMRASRVEPMEALRHE
jgi:predicted permease